MIGRVVTSLAGNVVGRAIAGAAGGPAGAAIGLALPFIARRIGPWGMVGLAVGGWAVRLARRPPQVPAAAPARAPIVTPPPIPMVVDD